MFTAGREPGKLQFMVSQLPNPDMKLEFPTQNQNNSSMAHEKPTEMESDEMESVKQSNVTYAAGITF